MRNLSIMTLLSKGLSLPDDLPTLVARQRRHQVSTHQLQMLQLVVANGSNITKVSTHLFLPSDATATAIYPAIVCFRSVLHVQEKRKNNTQN